MNEFSQDYENASYEDARTLLDDGDYDTGRKVLFKAAENGDTEAMHFLAICYDKGLYDFPIDREEYFRWVKEESENTDDPLTWYILALAYVYGDGTTKNDEEAFEWFKKSADAGYVGALSSVIEYYARGIGTKIDIQKAKEYLELLREHEDRDEELLNSLEAVFPEWEASAKALENKQKKNEYIKLSMDYKNGTNGCPKDLEQSFYWINKALEEFPNDPSVQVLVGIKHLDGEGIQKNMEKGIELVKKSADAGLGYGQFIYGRLHHFGGGSIEKDLYKAEYLMQQAIQNGWPQAENELRAIQKEIAELSSDSGYTNLKENNVLNDIKGMISDKTKVKDKIDSLKEDLPNKIAQRLLSKLKK